MHEGERKMYQQHVSSAWLLLTWHTWLVKWIAPLISRGLQKSNYRSKVIGEPEYNHDEETDVDKHMIYNIPERRMYNRNDDILVAAYRYVFNMQWNKSSVPNAKFSNKRLYINFSWLYLLTEQISP